MAKPTARVTDSLPISSIRIGDQLLRHDPNDESIVELAADLTRHGLLQPIGVAKIDTNHYQLLWGGRRLAAAGRIGWKHIPAVIYDPDEEPVKALALVENLHRQNLTLEEEIAAVNYMHTQDGKSPDQIAISLSKGRAWVMKRLSFDSFPRDVADALLNDQIPFGAAEVLAGVEDPGVRAYLTNDVRQKNLTIAQLKYAVAEVKAHPLEPGAVDRAVAAADLAAPPIRLHLPCEACHTPKPLEELVLIRVCRAGCETAAAERKDN